MCTISRYNVLYHVFLIARKFTIFSSVADPNPDPPDPHVLGLQDPDPLVRGVDPDLDPALDLDPDPSLIMQK